MTTPPPGPYVNGFLPMNWLHVFGSGWNAVDGEWVWALTPSTYRKHLALLERAKQRTGRELRQNSGPSCYRSYAAQERTRAYYESIGQANLAAVPGTSSHGGKWEGAYTFAIDYGNWADVYQGRRDVWFSDCRSVGLAPGMIGPARGYPDEPWHVIDLDPWAPIPASGGSTPFPTQEDDMPLYVRATLDMWPINGIHVIKAKYVLAYTPGQPLKVLSTAEWELLEAAGAKATDQTAAQLAQLIKSNGLIETYAYEPGGKPSGRIRYTRTDTTYPLVTSARSGV